MQVYINRVQNTNKKKSPFFWKEDFLLSKVLYNAICFSVIILLRLIKP
jgi:hypothetical protein